MTKEKNHNKMIMVKIPQKLYEELAAIKEERGYATMSELLRDALRDFVLLYRSRQAERRAEQYA
ncbi:MAG: ribbon-helix-helix protein, CopG family [Thermoproteus sp.]|nr:ribbon-helix-helix protein, CopG family [Thermoproteus sp.]